MLDFPLALHYLCAMFITLVLKTTLYIVLFLSQENKLQSYLNAMLALLPFL